jgi:uncharacterized protein (TIGR03118 family)
MNRSPQRVRAPSRPSWRNRRTARHGLVFTAVGAAGVLAVPLVASIAATPAIAAGPYTQTNLVSDIPGVARTTDPHLTNPWGMSEFPGGPLWVSDNTSSLSTLYTGDLSGSPLTAAGLVVRIPGSAPTGQVYNPTSGFVVRHGLQSGPAVFIFASENGDISGWNPRVGAGGAGPSTRAQLAATVPNAVYKGLAIVGDFLYATNFRTGHVDIFDSDFKPVTIAGGTFKDSKIPMGYAPFGIAYLGGKFYVSYAKQDGPRHDDVAGPGRGYIDVFSPEGTLIKRLVSTGHLNSPWGMVMAPATFGTFSNDLLVGNFGDGAINAYDPNTGVFLGPLMNSDGNPIRIQGLWGLIAGDSAVGTSNTIFFSAGIVGELHGLLGSLTPAS